MLIQNGKNQANYHIIETEAKTKSSSLNDENKSVITNIPNKKNNKIKKIPVLNFHNPINHTQNITKQKYFNIDDDNEIIYISPNKKIYNKTIQNEAVNYIKKKYNLTEVYLKNNTLINFPKNNMKDNKEISYLNANEFINLKIKIYNNFIVLFYYIFS